MKVLFEVSARHIHVSEEDFKAIYGKDELTKFKEISQPGQFAAEETVAIKGAKSTIEGVRILGPFRKETQVEIAATDCFKLGIKPKLALSGNLEDAETITISGPAGTIERKCAIVAKRHVHLCPETAEKLGVNTGDMIDIELPGDRAVVFKNVIVRASESDLDSFQVDTDEANAAFAVTESEAEII